MFKKRKEKQKQKTQTKTKKIEGLVDFFSKYKQVRLEIRVVRQLVETHYSKPTIKLYESYMITLDELYRVRSPPDLNVFGEGEVDNLFATRKGKSENIDYKTMRSVKEKINDSIVGNIQFSL